MRKITLAVLVLLIISNVVFVGMAVYYKIQAGQAKQKILVQQINAKNLSFAKLFVDNFLSGEKEISFDQRLKLENAVRDVNDQGIFTAWQNFTKSANQQEAQLNLGILLKTIIEKISY